VTNVLNGITAAAAADNSMDDRGTAVRITLHLQPDHVPVVTSNRVVADGFLERTDPHALVVGPTGLGLRRDGVLYVADSNGNRIAAIPNALARASALRDTQPAVETLVPEGTRDLFDLTRAPHDDAVHFVNDSGSRPASNSLQLLQR
jgi:hypothetical protein